MRITSTAARIGLAVAGGLGIIGASVAVASARGGGGDTAKVSYVAGQCTFATADSAAMGMLSQSGPHAQFGFGASGPGAEGDWHVVVVDTNDKGESIVAFDTQTGGVGTAWSTFANFDMLKGKNALAITADNSDGVHCDAMLFARV
jgi:hypothetical protein